MEVNGRKTEKQAKTNEALKYALEFHNNNNSK